MKKYQYLVLTVDNASDAFLTSILDDYGKNGWNLVNFTWTLHSNMIKFIFKMEVL